MEILKKINIKKAITHNFWLKLLALILAVFVWLYVAATITGGGQPA
ncbi:MAG: hypothetical protein K9L86_03435 [Candidatus Omnitrophica bacterium]|nr:hypothetical protein [Candidatus Omnitrophota bacterium]